MKRNTFQTIILMLMMGLVLSTANIQAQTAYEIVRKAEEKARGVETSQGEMTMTIVRPDWSRTMSLRSWSKGTDYSLILVLSPARDKGTTNLKRKKEVWSWMPRIERTIKLPPSMMAQSWMGSDFTNDDLVREFSLSEDYEHDLVGDSTIQGYECYKIKLTPKEEAAVIWGKVYLWISKDEFLQLRGEYFDEDDYLINIMQGSNVKEMGGKVIVTKMEMIPVEKEGHKTVMEFQKLAFDKPIPEAFFTVQNMKRVR